MIAILDCGTTNTKCYLATPEGQLLGESYVGTGCRDRQQFAEPGAYASFLVQVIGDTCCKHDVSFSSLSCAIAFGMVSSDLGLQVVPHLVAPAGLAALQCGVFTTGYEDFLGPGIPLLIIRGIKNPLPCERSIGNIFACDFMRGEETQVMGLLSMFKPTKAINVITLGTHFKAVHVDAKGNITTSMTTMSGQLFDCLVHDTIVGKSVLDGTGGELSMQPSEIASMARQLLQTYGFNRTILLPRFMESFTPMNSADRLMFLDLAIAFDDLHSIGAFFTDPALEGNTYYLVGQRQRCLNMQLALQVICPGLDVHIIDGREKNRDISISGSLAICTNHIQPKESK